MAKRRANGEGNIRKRKDGRWEGRYTAGTDPETGKQIFKNVLGKTQAEVKEKLKRALEEAKKVDFTRTGKYTVEQWMDEWFENVCKIKVRPSSHQTYRGYIDHHVAPNIGKIPLEKLSTMDLQKLYRKLMNKGRVERIEAEHQPKGLSAKTVRNINQVISSAMDFAVAQKIISENPCKAVALPKLEHKEMQTIPAEQLQAFLQEAKATGVYEMYYIELATGLRRGELLGLKWTDIDWKNGIIKVRRQVARVNGEIVEAPLKTKNSYRAVSISPQAIEVLREQKRKTNDQYVFPSPNGGPISPDSVNNMLKRVLERAGIPKSPNNMPAIYEASVKNVRELKKQVKIVKRLLNQALRANRMQEVDALTKTFALMYSAYAEVSFIKLIHTPYGFSESYIQQIQTARNLDEKWTKCMELALGQISSDHNKGDIANKLKKLRGILNEYIIAPSQIRNKIAHGQWSVCLNNDCTAINADMTLVVSSLDFVQIDRLFTIYEIFSQCIEDLIESPHKAHYHDYYSRLIELETYIDKTKNYTLQSKQAQLQSSPKYSKATH